MSWDDKLENNKFSITTGEGKVYFPLFKTGEKSKEFNTATFDFIDVSGSLVERKKPKSAKYTLVFWFQGADNVEQSEAFEKSAEDNRRWIVNHPFYNQLRGQPISISRNDTNFNITEITVEFWESISADYPKSNFSIKDNTYEKKQGVFDASEQCYSAKEVFKAEDVTKNKEEVSKIGITLSKIQSNETYAEYSNKVSTAIKANDNLVNDSLNAISKTQDTLNMPSDLVETVQNRFTAYKAVYNGLNTVFKSVPDKLFFQSIGAVCIAAMCDSTANFIFGVDFVTVKDVESTASQLADLYDQYLGVVDGASTSNYDLADQFNPDPVLQTELSNLINYTLGNIYNLAFDAKQERIVYTDKVTNLILLVHRYLGLDASDQNIEDFRTINNIKLNEVFRIERNREIKYYI